MPDIVFLTISILAGFLCTPVGLLPSILLFRDLANGTDGSDQTKRGYAATLWGGLGTTWVVASALAYGLLSLLFG